MKKKCEITNCPNQVYQSFFKYPNGKIWLCEEHTNEELDIIQEEGNEE